VEELPSEGGGRQIIARETVPYSPRRSGDIWAKGFSTLVLGVDPREADKFTKSAREVGIDAHYDSKTGALCAANREAYAQEVTRRGYYNSDPGDVEVKYAKALGK
jgi:hypothetical protein